MITGIAIENFKAIRDRVAFELKPITLLFGPNSSGKTSILQLILMLKQTADSADRAQVLNLGDERSLVSLGTFREVQNWQQYAAMLTQWASSVEKFETSVRRISELPGLVFFEIEERHFRDGDVHTVNSMTVFDFDDHGRIRRLNVYLQQGRET